MIKRISYLFMLLLLISCTLKVQAQVRLPEQVCVGTVQHYWVEGLPGSTYTWRINGVIQSSTADNIDIQWNEIGSFTLDVQEHQLTCDGDVQSGVITVTDQLIPEFTVTNEYCAGSLIAALPTTSNNGINGTWTPEINNTQTTTYTFTPEDEQCAVPVELTITITDGILPRFEAIAAICSGSPAISLPTTSMNNITGSWSPAFNNTATTEYTFTPDAGQCATTTTLTVVVNEEIIPTFDPVGAYCAGSVIAALPTTSTNGITGTWNPAIDNTRTTEYTFTPDAGQCGTTTTMIITISDEIIPTFAQVGPYCAGSAIPELPTTSINNITGTWSPAIDNTRTATYTFTPDAGQCGTTTTMTITISDEITPTFAQVGPYCAGSDIAELPTTSINNITGSWSPTIDNTRTATYTFTPDAGQCGTATTMTITISDEITPTFAQVGPYCAGSAIPELPTTSINNISGTWSPAIDNTRTATYTFTPDPGQCGTTTTMTITISDEITPTFAQVGPYCAGSAISELPTTSTNNISGTWSPAIDNTRTATYNFTPDAGQCGTTTTMTITISDEITPTFAQVGPYCAGSAIPELPTTSINNISGTWSPAIDNTRTGTYTFTPDAGQCGTTTTMTITISDEITPTFAQVGPYCAGSAIPELPTTSINNISGTWSPAIDNTRTATYTFTPDAGQCGTATTMTITISDEIVPTFAQVGPYCAGSAIPELPTTSINNITGSWSPSIDNTRTATYTFTPDPGQCGVSTTLTIVVNEETIPVFDPMGPYQPGSLIADLPAISNNGITGTWSPAINNTQTTTYTFMPDPGQCAVSTSLTIEILGEIIPLFDPIGPLCSGSVIAALPTTSNNGITGTWSPEINNTRTTEYTFTPDPGQGAVNVTLTIEITDGITPVFDAIGPLCAGSSFTLPVSSNNGITGTWSPAIDNTRTTEYTFTPDPGQCGVSTTLTVTISNEIVPVFEVQDTYCAGSDIAALPTTSENGITGSWSPGINNTQTTEYTFTPDPGQCGVPTTLIITISNEIIPTFDPIEPSCAGTAIAALPTTSVNGITGSWSPEIDNTRTTTYFFTPDAGQCAVPTSLTIEITNGIIPVFEATGSYCPGDAIEDLPTVSNNGIHGSWSPAINNQLTTTYTFTPNEEQCAAPATLTITITPGILPVFDPVESYCPGSAIAALPSTSTNGITGSWSPAINNQVTTTYTFTPDEGQCAQQTTLTIIIDPGTIPSFDPVDNYCPGAAIAALPTTSNNGITGSWSPEINNQVTTTYTFTPDEGQCAISATLTIVIDQSNLPTFEAVGPYCPGSNVPDLPSISNNGISGSWSPAIDNSRTTTYTFTPDEGQCASMATLTIVIEGTILPEFDAIAAICSGEELTLPTVSNNGISGSWTPAINNTQTTTYTFTPDAGQCGLNTTLTVEVNRGITPTFDDPQTYCPGDAIADLPTVSNNGIHGSWSPEINNRQTTTYTFTPDNGQCASSTTMTIVINQGIIPTFDPVGPYCQGDAISDLPTVSNNGITGSWSPEIDNSQSATYTFTPDGGQCASTTLLSIVIEQSITPVFEAVGPYCPGAEIPALPTVSTNGIPGSWSPEIDNTRTTTYTFTSEEGRCPSTATLTIVIDQDVTPTFDPVGPFCPGAEIAALPTVSTNGISGTWSPALDNTQTTTYTFTPDEGQCGRPVELTIEITDQINPTFDAMAPICSGTTFTLPLVSREGIAGTWSPEVDNTRTTEYTFTPAGGACAATATLTVEVVNSTTPEFSSVGPFCPGADIAELPRVSNNNISGSWSPAINNMTTTTYTFIPDEGQCAEIVTLTIEIGESITPTFDPLGTYCRGASIASLPTVSREGISGSWSPEINNMQSTTYTFTPEEGQCAAIATLTILITDQIIPEFDEVGTYCPGSGIAALPTISNNGISGSWNPALNNQQTTTYTFTPDEGQCAATASLTIVVDAHIVPEFEALAPICSGGVIQLPDVSNNGISGTWSPAINNTQTTTYTFTPDEGQCAIPTILIVVVEQSIIPTFDPVGSYCPGAFIAALPTTSTNGIHGSWSPEIDNTRTTTYLFTPDEGECFSTASLTITIEQNRVPTFDPVPAYCPGANIAALPTVSNNGISGSWSPEINNTRTTTYTFTPDEEQCAATATLTIFIEQSILPVFEAVGPFCPGENIPTLPTVSNNGIRGSWSPEIDNTRTTTYTFTPDAGQCGSVTTLTIEINQSTLPVFAAVGPYCPGEAIPALPLVSNNGISGTWTPAINNQQTTTYTFTPDEGQCGSATNLTIVINPAVTPAFASVGPYCAGAAIAELPTVSNNGIRGSWSPAINNLQTTLYTFTPDAGQCAQITSLTITISDQVTPTFNLVTAYCTGAAIPALPTVSNNGIRGTWSPAIDNTQTTIYTFTPNSGQCGESTTLTIEISDQITPVFDPVGPFCQGTAIAALPTMSNNGIRGSWSPAINNQQTTTYTFTPNSGQCGTTTSMTIEINDEILPTFDPVGPYTRGSVIAALPTMSNNGIAGTWSPAINNQQTTTYIFTPNNGQCASSASLTIEITDQAVPTFDPVGPYCAGSVIAALPTVSNNGIAGTWSPAINNQQTTTYTFTPNAGQSAGIARLTIAIEPEVRPTFAPVGSYCAGTVIADLPTTSTNGITGTWTPSINNQQTTTYTFTPDAGQCATSASLTIVISDEITPTFASVGPYCAGDIIDALPIISNNGIRGSWSPAINNLRTTTYTFTPDAGQCAGVATTTITVNPAITPVFDPAGPTCRGTAIAQLPTVSNNGIRGSWSPAINNTQTTTYTFTPTPGQCAVPVELIIEVVDEILPVFDPVGPYCPGSAIAQLPTISNNGIRGSWSPAINNRRTTTYTFTPDAGQCGSITTMTIAIEENAVPVFDAVGPFCSGAVIAELPTVSNNGIRGSWRPAINNSHTTTYTFTPDAGQCGASTTLTITITDPVIPTFEPVGPYCPGAIIADLPSVSTNGITGTWSPAINNQQSTTYTFTPDAGQCATNATLRIVIDQRTIPTFDPVASYCSGSSIAALRTVSNNGIRGSWRPAINNTRTTTYTFTPDAGQCGETTTLTIEITDEVDPTFDPIGPYPRGAAIAALRTVSNNGIRGSWRPAINNMQTTTYTFTPDAGQCSRPYRMTIAITDDIIPVFDPLGPFCPGSEIAALPTVSNNGISGSWSPAINNMATTTYVFTPDAGQSAAATTLTITISDEITPTFDPVGPYCPEAVIAELPTVSNNGIRGSWTPAINNLQTTTYTFTPEPGQCGTITTLTIDIDDEIIPTFNPVRPYCPGSAIEALPTVSNNGISGSWSPAINNEVTTVYTFTPDAGQCALPTTLTIEIGIDIVPEFDLIGPFCPGTDINALPVVSNNGVVGTWSPVINNMVTTNYLFTPDAGQCATTTSLTCEIGSEITPVFTQAGPYCIGSAIEALPMTSLNGVRGSWSPAIDNMHTTTYTFTPEPGLCALSTVMTITISEETIPTFAAVQSYCAGSAIPALPVTSLNGVHGTWSPAINNMQTTTYTFIPDPGECATTESLTIVIDEAITPTFNAVGPFCQGSVIAPLPTVSLNGIRGTWSPELNNQVTTVYTFTPDAGQCAHPATLTIEINEGTEPAFAQPDLYCAGAVIAALPRTSLNGITGSWSPAINNTRTTTYTFTPDAGQCAKSTQLTILINPEPATPVARVIEPDCTIPTGTIEMISPRGTQYQYRLDGGIYQDEALFGGLSPESTHTVQVRDRLTGCESDLATVSIGSLPQPPLAPVAIVVANPKCDGGGSIEVINPTGADYEYRMDGGAYQSSAVFANVTWGEHFITVRNKINGCESAATRVFIAEVEEDMDYDGIPDSIDIDVDGDGILNSFEGNPLADFDGDGRMNYMDIDADGDGIVDNLEAQLADQYILPSNTDQDNDGLDDAYDTDQGGTEIMPVNTDRSDFADYQDLDADNDLVPDHIEGHDEDANGKADHLALGRDSDHDGLDDAFDMIVNECGALENALGSNAPTQDFDGDGKPDWRDENDDDDEYLTRFEDLNADNDFSNDDIDFDGYPEYLDYGRDCDLFIPDAFSPNGDNVHDLYMIYCINHYPDATIYIFDQLGNKIYEKRHYGNLDFWKTNDAAWWDGKPTRGPGYSRNNLVPPGTYYYVLDLGNGEVKKSYVFVSY